MLLPIFSAAACAYRRGSHHLSAMSNINIASLQADFRQLRTTIMLSMPRLRCPNNRLEARHPDTMAGVAFLRLFGRTSVVVNSFGLAASCCLVSPFSTKFAVNGACSSDSARIALWAGVPMQEPSSRRLQAGLTLTRAPSLSLAGLAAAATTCCASGVAYAQQPQRTSAAGSEASSGQARFHCWHVPWCPARQHLVFTRNLF